MQPSIASESIPKVGKVIAFIVVEIFEAGRSIRQEDHDAAVSSMRAARST